VHKCPQFIRVSDFHIVELGEFKSPGSLVELLNESLIPDGLDELLQHEVTIVVEGPTLSLFLQSL